MIIHLSELRQKKEKETRIKIEAQAKIAELRTKNGNEFNQKFFELVDIFFRRYPGALTEFDKFVEENWK